MTTIDDDRLAELLDRFVNDLGATVSAGNVLIGDKLGLRPGQRCNEPPAARRSGDARSREQ